MEPCACKQIFIVSRKVEFVDTSADIRVQLARLGSLLEGDRISNADALHAQGGSLAGDEDLRVLLQPA